MVEGLYRGWDELRSVPAGTQSGLRVIVLFTDGASQQRARELGRESGHRESAAHVGLPGTPPDPDGQTWNNPAHRRAVRHRDRQQHRVRLQHQALELEQLHTANGEHHPRQVPSMPAT